MPSARGCCSPTGSSTSGSAPPRLSPAPPIAGRWACRSAAPGSTVSTGGGMPSSPREPGASSTIPPGSVPGRAERRSCGCRPGSPIPGHASRRRPGRGRAATCALRTRCAWPPRGPSGSPCAAGPSSVTSTSAPPLRGSRSRSPEPRDIVNNVGSIVFEDGYGADRGFLEPDEGQYQEPVEVFAWCGGSVLLRPRYLADVGLFDERFFLYYEDTDLAWRGRTRLALRIRARRRGAPCARRIDGRGVAGVPALRRAQPAADAGKGRTRDLAWGALWRYLLVTLSYALATHRRSGAAAPPAKRRAGAAAAGLVRRLCWLAPAMLRERWGIRRRHRRDGDLRAWSTPR